MKTIAIVCPKSGVGKNLDCRGPGRACREGFPRVAMIDLNRDQANFTQFWQLRGEPDNPRLFSDHEDLVIDLLLAQDGWDVCIIDTLPSYLDVIDTAVMVASAAIIPVKCSIFDAGSIGPIVEMRRRRRVPYAFVLNDLDQRVQDPHRAGDREPQGRRPGTEDRRLAPAELHRCAQHGQNRSRDRPQGRRRNRRAVVRGRRSADHRSARSQSMSDDAINEAPAAVAEARKKLQAGKTDKSKKATKEREKASSATPTSATCAGRAAPSCGASAAGQGSRRNARRSRPSLGLLDSEWAEQVFEAAIAAHRERR